MKAQEAIEVSNYWQAKTYFSQPKMYSYDENKFVGCIPIG